MKNPMWRSILYRQLKMVRKIGKRYRTIYCTTRNWLTWALRQTLFPIVRIPCWVTSSGGAKFFLSDDPVDDRILERVLGERNTLYYPSEISQFSGAFLVLEIGAHHGFYTVETLRRYPEATIIAVEPSPDAVELLKKNLVANDMLHKVEIVPAAISDQDGTALLKYSLDNSWGATIMATQHEEESGCEVRTLRLSTILQDRKPNLVKCNAEGAEFYVFPQLFSLGIHPDIIILMAHAEYGSVDDLSDLFRSHGYRLRDAGSNRKRVRLHCLFDGNP